MKLKKILAQSLAVAMVLSSVPVANFTALAAEDTAAYASDDASTVDATADALPAPYGYKNLQTSVYKGYKQDKIEMRGDRAEMSDFPLYLNTVAGGFDCRDQTIGGFSFVVKIYAVPVVEIIG